MSPLVGTELRVRDPDGEGVGEVEFRGPSVIPGYWNDPDATAAAIDADGWLATGDLGRLDEDGDLHLVDRKKELIIRGGYNVYPREVEEALYAHPDVLEAAVVGVPDATLGEEVAALVVRRPGTAVTAEELEAWARERVAATRSRAGSPSSTRSRRGRPGRSSSARSTRRRSCREDSSGVRLQSDTRSRAEERVSD